MCGQSKPATNKCRIFVVNKMLPDCVTHIRESSTTSNHAGGKIGANPPNTDMIYTHIPTGNTEVTLIYTRTPTGNTGTREEEGREEGKSTRARVRNEAR